LECAVAIFAYFGDAHLLIQLRLSGFYKLRVNHSGPVNVESALSDAFGAKHTAAFATVALPDKDRKILVAFPALTHFLVRHPLLRGQLPIKILGCLLDSKTALGHFSVAMRNIRVWL
jgi:hypothetical protein